MMTNQITYHKDRLSNWILIVSFLLSVFSFSGYVHHADKGQHKTTQTEFVSSYKVIKTGRTISYTRAIVSVYVQKSPEIIGMDHPLSICGYETNLLIAFNRFIKTQFDHNKNQSLSFKPIEPFSPRKTFPHSTDEGTMPAFLG